MGDKHKPKVSVIIPAYNADKTIVLAIRSVQEQTFQDFEIVVVDDCSIDNTVVKVCALSDNRIRVLHAQRNSGPAAARNLAIDNAEGEWLSFLDADDQYSPDHLQRLIDFSRYDGVNFIVPNKVSAIPDSQGRLRPVKGGGPQIEATKIGASDFDIGLQREYASVSRDYVRQHGIAFNESGSGGDWMFVMASLLLSGACGYWLSEPTYLYRVTGRHFSSSLKAIRHQHLVLTALTEDDRLPNDVRMKLARSRSAVRRRLPVAALRERRWSELSRIASESPADLVFLPGPVVRFAFRKLFRTISVRQK